MLCEPVQPLEKTTKTYEATHNRAHTRPLNMPTPYVCCRCLTPIFDVRLSATDREKNDGFRGAIPKTLVSFIATEATLAKKADCFAEPQLSAS